ncbi:MAG: amino acid hydroxymethyltransferase, partial [Firmicutes bacterium]|nr:amino acid hydroxymethyltransferase [Bacillota bacterium]
MGLRNDIEINTLEEFKKLYSDYLDFDKTKIPLCAAETYVSAFVKQALPSIFGGKYAMNFQPDNHTDDFIGSQYIRQLFELVAAQCKSLFGSQYADARPLSGINCFTLVIMSLISNKKSYKALITDSAQGGHTSIAQVLDSFNIPYDAIPYDFKNYQIDYSNLNKQLSSNHYDFLIFCQSDLLQVPDIIKIMVPKHTTILYDGTQTLGLIAGKVLANPLEQTDNIILFGGTQKTLAGSTAGLILTNNNQYRNKLETAIVPKYLRNVQPNKVAAILLTLIEQEIIGAQYQAKIVSLSNQLGKMLESKGMRVAKLPSKAYSQTHQVFWLTTKDEMNTIYKN